jgi:hypothetical protein
VPHITCPVAVRHAQGQTRRPNSSQATGRSQRA